MISMTGRAERERAHAPIVPCTCPPTRSAVVLVATAVCGKVGGSPLYSGELGSCLSTRLASSCASTAGRGDKKPAPFSRMRSPCLGAWCAHAASLDRRLASRVHRAVLSVLSLLGHACHLSATVTHHDVHAWLCHVVACMFPMLISRRNRHPCRTPIATEGG